MLVFVAAAALLILNFGPRLRRSFAAERTVEQVTDTLGPGGRELWRERLDTAGVGGWPGAWILVGAKQEKTLALWAAGEGHGPAALVHTFKLLGASGGPGPKLREGDRQVPEGRYTLEALNPNSRFHLSMKINYPNAVDRARAKRHAERRGAFRLANTGGAEYWYGMNHSIQLVARIYETLAAGDIPGFLGFLSPEIVWNEAEGNPVADGNPYVGAQAIAEGVFGRVLAEWNDFGVEVQEIVGGDGVVTMFGRYRGTHGASKKPLDVQVAHTWWLENDKVVRFQQMLDTAGMAAASQS